MYDRSTVYPIILKRIADGESLREICKTEDLPTAETIRVWLADDEAFSAQYARAHVEQADYWVHRIKEVVTAKPDMVDAAEGGDTNHKAGGSRVDTGYVAWQKLQADTYKWFASKLNPKKYADKVDHTLSAPDGGPAVVRVLFGRD